jgi:hypothetical protein
MTQDNLHVEAVIEIAKFVAYKHYKLEGAQQIVERAKAVKTLYKHYGFMPPHLNIIRDDVRNRAMSFLTETERQRINSAL